MASNVDAQIFFVARLPRALAAALVGGALAAAGVVFQALLRNPLATPFTLGISAGAALGAMLAMTFGGAFAAQRRGRPCRLASLAGPWRRRDRLRARGRAAPRAVDHVLLLAGVTLNSFFSALILFVQYFADIASVDRRRCAG